MNRLAAILTLSLALVAELASAHAHLQSSTPADGSTLAAIPGSVSLQFAEPVQLTALAIQGKDITGQKLSPLPTAPSTAFTVALPAIGAGQYVVCWRAVSDDRHVMSGSIRFTVRPTKNSTPK